MIWSSSLIYVSMLFDFCPCSWAFLLWDDQALPKIWRPFLKSWNICSKFPGMMEPNLSKFLTSAIFFTSASFDASLGVLRLNLSWVCSNSDCFLPVTFQFHFLFLFFQYEFSLILFYWFLLIYFFLFQHFSHE